MKKSKCHRRRSGKEYVSYIKLLPVQREWTQQKNRMLIMNSRLDWEQVPYTVALTIRNHSLCISSQGKHAPFLVL
jgi:hypothetical protein